MVIKRLFYFLFLGIVTFVFIGALVGFVDFALKTPLAFLELISPIKNTAFLVFLAVVIFVCAGVGMDVAFRHGFSFGKKSLFSQAPALTEDGSLVFVMGEETTPDGKVYVKVLMPLAHPIPGFLKILPKECISILKNEPSEMIKIVMSDGVLKLVKFEVKKDE